VHIKYCKTWNFTRKQTHQWRKCFTCSCFYLNNNWFHCAGLTLAHVTTWQLPATLKRQNGVNSSNGVPSTLPERFYHCKHAKTANNSWSLQQDMSNNILTGNLQCRLCMCIYASGTYSKLWQATVLILNPLWKTDSSWVMYIVNKTCIGHNNKTKLSCTMFQLLIFNTHKHTLEQALVLN